MKQNVPLTQLNGFFEYLADALERSDAKTMAHLYLMPCTLLSDDVTLVFTEPAKLEGFFSRGAALYKQMGVARVQAELWNRQNWTEKMTLAKVKWKYTDKQAKDIYSCDYNYVLKCDKDGCQRILMSVSLNEKERMEIWQKQMRKK